MNSRLYNTVYVGAVLSMLLFVSAASAQVRGVLVAADQGVQPGTRTTLALRLDHEPGWHTYWVSPGIGMATSVQWTLPEGWVAGDVDWPVPVKIFTQSGDVSGHGFEGTAYLPIDIVASPDAVVGEQVRLKATVKWLMCEYELCIPGGTELELTLPITAEPANPVPAVRAALDSIPMPEAGEGLEISATRDGELMTLNIEGDVMFLDPHFFSFDELVLHDAVQEYEITDGRLQASLSINRYYKPEITTLSGVFAFTDGEGNYRGLLVNALLSGAASAGGSSFSTLSVWQALLFAFVGGVILNLMPCVLPILSMKALSLANASGLDATALRREGYLYTLGVVLSFIAMAVLLLAARSALGAVGWGFHLQNSTVVLSLALVMAAVGFNLMGVFEMGLGIGGAGDDLTKGHSAKAAFFTGVLAVVVAAPCTAPFMAAALGAALVQPAPIAVAIFAMLGVGLAFPYLLAATVPAARRWLPKPGAWMPVFRQVLAFPMFATAIWLLWVVGAQRGSDAVTLGLIAVLLLGLASWAYGGLQRSSKKMSWAVTAIISLALLPWVLLEVGKIGPPEAGAKPRIELFEEVTYSPTALDEALATGLPVFAYFTADWCVTCKVNERIAIKTEVMAEVFKSNGVQVMVGDWTNQNSDITEILLKYKRAGVPMYLYFSPGASVDEGVLLPQILTPGIIADAVTGS